jgi:hypothetical protein
MLKMNSTQEKLELVAIIKGCYTDNFGNLTSYQYRIFNTDTVETFIKLTSYELEKHPSAKQEICFMNQLNNYYIAKSIKGV